MRTMPLSIQLSIFIGKIIPLQQVDPPYPFLVYLNFSLEEIVETNNNLYVRTEDIYSDIERLA